MNAKITTITNTALQKAHENITNNRATINNIQNQLTMRKEDISTTPYSVQEIIENINDTNKRVTKCEKNFILSNMTLKSIEKKIGEKSYQMSYSDNRSIQNMEF